MKTKKTQKKGKKMKKTLLIATSLSLLATASFADNLANSDLLSESLVMNPVQTVALDNDLKSVDLTDIKANSNLQVESPLFDISLENNESVEENAFMTSSLLEESFVLVGEENNSNTPAASASETSKAEQKKAEGWGSWMAKKAKGVAYWTADKGLRTATGVVAVAYGTPYLNPVVDLAAEGADRVTYWAVAGATGPVIGPVAGFVAGKTAKVVTKAAGYYIAPTVAYTAGYCAKEIVQGTYAAGKATYNGVSSAYNYLSGSASDAESAPETSTPSETAPAAASEAPSTEA